MSTLVILKVDTTGVVDPTVDFICLTKGGMPNSIEEPENEIRLIKTVLEETMGQGMEVTVWNVGQYSHERLYPPVPGQRD